MSKRNSIATLMVIVAIGGVGSVYADFWHEPHQLNGVFWFVAEQASSQYTVTWTIPADVPNRFLQNYNDHPIFFGEFNPNNFQYEYRILTPYNDGSWNVSFMDKGQPTDNASTCIAVLHSGIPSEVEYDKKAGAFMATFDAADLPNANAMQPTPYSVLGEFFNESTCPETLDENGVGLGVNLAVNQTVLTYQ